MTERLWAPWRMEYIQGGVDAGGCIFCDKAAADDDEANLIVHRGERAYVLMNLYPYSNGHLMVAPYRHVAAPGDLDDGERAELWALLDRALGVLGDVMAPHGFNAGINIGPTLPLAMQGEQAEAGGPAVVARRGLAERPRL